MAELNTVPASGSPQEGAESTWEGLGPKFRPFVYYCRRNPQLVIGACLLISLGLFVVLGYMFHDVDKYRPLSAPTKLSPRAGFLFGTDRQGRDILAVMIAGTPLTLRIGLIAGGIGVVLGTIVGFIAAYYGGLVDGVLRTIVDVGLTIPGLLILILIAVNMQSGLTVDQMGLAVSVVAWVWPARTIRSQVLVMREQLYVEIARLSGTSGLAIIFKEMMPNLMPYLTASFVSSVAAAILASIGLEALGLGPFDSPTIGMTIYWNIQFSSVLHGMWWWFTPPIVVIVMVFVGLFMLSMGLDEWSNPRLRKRV